MPDSRSATPRSSQPARTRPRAGRRQHARPFKPFTPEQLAERAAAIPVISFPDLPVSARRDEIARAIRDHQVVIVSGETGSGKTTQLPKICMQLGRGVAGMIGHTQPRRLAARSVADRIAHELGQTVGRERGQVVGYQVRFTDEIGPTTLVKLMTDGILLAEIQSDPMLRRYDTLIIDEAHERSLNIDFILGYVARLLPARPDLKVIITSATIDSDRFARHFGTWEGTPGSGRLIEPAPVIEVSGRTYPVEIRYRPLGPTTPSSYTSEASPAQAEKPVEVIETTDVTESGPMQLVLEDPDDELATLGYGMGEDIDVETAICHAVDELSAEGDGDILVFLPGERDIRDTEAALLDHLKGRGRRAGDDKGARPDDIEILPLYARLTAAEQHRVFEPHRLRRVVLATNVAETSLTVPGIRYVIDPGLARISRYSNKTKVQRLPIEPVSQASANQRAGRCGRVAEGVAIRLFSQADYLSRPRFTEPEILRTSLASVILQMASLGLGAVEDFPFLDAPDRRAVRDGVALLVEIGALASGEPQERRGRGDRSRTRDERGTRDAGNARDTRADQDASGTAPTARDAEQPDAAPASSQYRLTGIGRDLARLPIDPRLGRMLLEAERLGCASEVLVIVAALSIQDVRERPAEHQGTADASHARLADPHSDFITYLNLWRYLAVQARDLSGSAFRRLCRAEFFHYLRWREWRDVVGQLRQMARALGIGVGPVGEPSTGDVVEAARFGGAQDAAVRAVLAYGQGPASVDADQVHRSLLVGLLSYLGSWDETRRDYEGARGTHFTIWPGSGVSGHPAWVMTAELVETSRLFARTVARIRPEWVEPAARGLLKRSYSEPFWSVGKGAAMVRERVTLYGLTLAADREVLLGRLGDLVIDEAVAASRSHAPRAGSLEALAAGLVSASKDPLSSGSFEPRHFEELAAAREGTTARELAREMFIRNALVDGQWRERHGFQRRNEALVEQAREVERRSRTHGLVADEQARFRFFDDLIPEHVTSAAAFNRWWKDERRSHPDLLIYPASLLMPREATSGEGFPDRWQCGDLSLALSYEFAPGSPRDGVSMRIPIEVLERVSDAGTDWLVPGMREDLLTEAIRALPKGVRRLLAPAPDVAASVARWIEQAGDQPAEAVVASADAHAGEARTGARAGGSIGKRGGQKAAQADEPDPLSLDAAMGRLAAWGATSGRVSTRNSPAKASKKGAQKATAQQASAGASAGEATGAGATGAAAQPGTNPTTGALVGTGSHAGAVASGAATPASASGTPAAGASTRRTLTDGPVLDALAHAVRVLRGVDLSEADLAHARAHLPDHLRMTFVVTDASGRELGSGKDLAYLQRSLASDANKAVRTAVRAALEEASEKQARRNKRGRGTSRKAATGANNTASGAPSPTDTSTGSPGGESPSTPAHGATATGTGPRDAAQASAPAPNPAFHADAIAEMPMLPRSITQTSGAMTLRAFPALVPQGSAAAPAAGVRVMASAAEADREHRAGLARLLLTRVALATNRVTTRWTGREALMLAASPYADTAALVADAQLASALALVDELSTPANVRDPEAFETLVAAARDAHEDRVYQILSHVVRALEASAEADAAVRSHPQASLKETTRDVAAHGRTLLYEGFVSATPASALPHLARYLRAGAVRIERAASSPGALGRDLEDMDRIHQAEADIAATRQALERRPYEARSAAALTQARWMAEELRVSMFAQTLGTPNKVSMKRLLGVLAGAR
ncbi:DUF3418 domain-containing protein [Schaalia sp. HMT-172]|uniref:DUF3418 domain-containing protein n=3 Tax=Actinomycetaceae TaxID=2049 RepID=UPI0027299297|nr:DUF3418 domain-containing protein [Schaalia sp. HMT-172]WLD78174.1 DUF3418 domain-containing protein [Schaalia sp. HMT-172]